jgi:tetratricopeptide (TPR) repeat protein
MAHACAALHYNEAELLYLKQALDAEPKDLEVNRHCAHSLGRLGQYDQAIACWHRVETLRGFDEEAARNISRLSDEKMRSSQARANKTAAKPVVPAIAAATVGEAVLPVSGLSAEERLEHAISLDPSNPTNYLRLVELLVDNEDWSAAENLLAKAIAECGGHESLKTALGTVKQLANERLQKSLSDCALQGEKIEQRKGLSWFELGLGMATVFLVLQLIPRWEMKLHGLIDFRHWSSIGWLIFNSAVVAVLFGVRIAGSFGSSILSFVKRGGMISKRS